MSEPTTALVTRAEAEKGLAAQLRSEATREQIRAALPENVSIERFERAFLTAIATDEQGALLKVERPSLFRALTKCAMDGLLPDGREAAIVAYGDKAGYLPMVGGVRKIAADYGWTIRTRVVREGDHFEFFEEPAMIDHRPSMFTGEGADTRPLVAAWAVATHRDGRRIQRVLDRAEIEKRRRKAKTQSIWNEWTAQMYEKTVAHDIFDELPLGGTDADRERIQRILAAWADNPGQAAAVMYPDSAGVLSPPADVEAEGEVVQPPAASPDGPPDSEDGGAAPSDPEPVETQMGSPSADPAIAAPPESSQDSPDGRADSQPEPRGHARPGDGGGSGDQEPGMGARTPAPTSSEPEPELPPEEPAEADYSLTESEERLLPDALKVKLPQGSYQGRTLEKVIAYGDSGAQYIGWLLKQPWVREPKDAVFFEALQIVAKAKAPDVYREWKETQG